MAFDEELHRYLDRIASPGRVPYRVIDPEDLRKHLLRRLAELDEPGLVRGLFRYWSPKLRRLAAYLSDHPSRAIPNDRAGALAYATRVLDSPLGFTAESPIVEALELRRIADGFGDHGHPIGDYALENRLVRGERGLSRATELGRIFLKLRGKDAVRWLLTIEVVGSRGWTDPWRTPRELLSKVLNDGEVVGEEDDDGDFKFSFATPTLDRLASLSVLDPWLESEGGPRYRYVLNSEMRDIVVNVLDGGPWSSAVAALIEDERALVLGGTSGAAADATIDQTRMIAHEVRNALVPARHHLDALLAASTEESSRDRVEATRRGVVRVLGFVDELVATSELVEEPAAALALSSVVTEAIGWIEGGDRVTVDESVARVSLRAPRTRLARALVNVLLNAVQSTPASGAIRVSARDSVERVEIAVDDAGPGVPEADRARVFDDGFTTRPGGSGFGLAFVRNVVETRFRGTVRCEASDLGGARFVIAIPKVPTP